MSETRPLVGVVTLVGGEELRVAIEPSPDDPAVFLATVYLGRGQAVESLSVDRLGPGQRVELRVLAPKERKR